MAFRIKLHKIFLWGGVGLNSGVTSNGARRYLVLQE